MFSLLSISFLIILLTLEKRKTGVLIFFKNWYYFGKLEWKWVNSFLKGYIYWFRKWKRHNILNLFYNIIFEYICASSFISFQILHIFFFHFIRWDWWCEEHIWFRTSKTIGVISSCWLSLCYCFFFQKRCKRLLNFQLCWICLR